MTPPPLLNGADTRGELRVGNNCINASFKAKLQKSASNPEIEPATVKTAVNFAIHRNFAPSQSARSVFDRVEITKVARKFCRYIIAAQYCGDINGWLL